MIGVGAYAGGRVGRGVGVSLGLGHRARTLWAMVGSTGGLWCADRLTQDWGEEVTATAGSTGVVRVELPSPAALLTLVIGATHGSDGTNVPPVQLLRLSF